MASEMADQGMFEAQGFVQNKDNCWMKMEGFNNIGDDDGVTTTSCESTSLGEYSRTSTSQGSTSSSSDLVDDASSSSSTNSSSNSNNGPLYELSELMAHLPIKRGLSKYFQGKSQSFASLSSVKSLEELAKKESPYNCRKKMKACKSYGGGLHDTHKLYTLPRATISKKVVSRNINSYSLSSLSNFPGNSRTSRGSFLNGRPPLVPVQKSYFSSVLS